VNIARPIILAGALGAAAVLGLGATASAAPLHGHPATHPTHVLGIRKAPGLNVIVDGRKAGPDPIKWKGRKAGVTDGRRDGVNHKPGHGRRD
jgi:hypothetical protein